MSRPGLSYWLGKQLYVAVTNRSHAAPLIALRGPGFAMPPDAGFCKLEGDEPTPQEIFDVVDQAYERDERKKIVGMGEDDLGVTFAGFGEPLLRLDTVTESVRLIKESRHGVPFRIKTSGLTGDGDNQAAAVAIKEAGIQQVSVSLPADNPKLFDELMKPDSAQYSFGMVCDFITQLVDHGVQVECTTVKAPGVDVSSVRQLAHALGAIDTRVVTYHE